MKRQEGGILSPEQKEWIEFLDNYGMCVAVAKGFEEAKRILKIYMKGDY
jgi:hypothetical protein